MIIKLLQWFQVSGAWTVMRTWPIICIVHCRFSTFQCFFDRCHRRVIFCIFQCHVPSMLSEHNINGAIFGSFTKSLSYVLNDFWVAVVHRCGHRPRRAQLYSTPVQVQVHMYTGTGTTYYMTHTFMYVCHVYVCTYYMKLHMYMYVLHDIHVCTSTRYVRHCLYVYLKEPEWLKVK